MGSGFLEVVLQAGRAARAAARARLERLMDRLQHLADFVRTFIFPADNVARPYLLMALFAAVVLGIGGARLLLQDDPGSGQPGQSPGSAAVIQTPAMQPSATSSPIAPRATPRATATPAPTPSPTPGLLALRGVIDTSTMSGVGLVIGSREVLLSFDADGGPIGGTFTIGIERFPIGSLLTATFDGEDDPDFAVFKRCTVTLVLVAAVGGSYDPASGRIGGEATFKPITDDVDDCLRTRPANLTINPDDVAKPTTVAWRGTFDGTTATGIIDLKPPTEFTARLED